MPEVVVATIAAASVEQLIVNFAISFAAGKVMDALFAPDVPDNQSGFAAEATGRQHIVRSAVDTRRVIYGETRVSGPLTYAKVAGASNEFLVMLIPLGAHEVTSIGDVFFNDQPIRPSHIGGAANEIIGGYWIGGGQVHKHLGGEGQVADPHLMAFDAAWTPNHRGDGVPYLYCLLHWNVDRFPGGIPNISAVVRGKKLYDPRTTLTVYSSNPALAIRDYLTSSAYGLGCETSEINDASFIAAANICDERVPVPSHIVNFTVGAQPDDNLYLAEKDNRLNTGDKVTASSTGVLPSPLLPATSYYVIRVDDATLQIAATYENALLGLATDMIDAGGGSHFLTHVDQVRYDINGTVNTGEDPMQALKSMLTSMAGVLVYTQGSWRCYAGAYRSPSGSLNASHLRGPIRLTPRLDRKGLYNAVRGTYVSRFNAWQPADYPMMTNAAYAAQDGGTEIVRDLALPYTTDSFRAQRIAKIFVEKSRQAIRVQWPGKPSCFKHALWDNVPVTVSQLGWSAKEFSVTGWTFNASGGVDLALQEEASEAYDWSSAEATGIDPAPNTDLPDPFTALAPGAPVVTEELYETTGSAGTKARAIVTWAAPADAFIASYRLEYKAAGDSDYIQLSMVPGTSQAVDDLTPGLYDFRVKSINTLGVSSAYSVVTRKEILGLIAPPEDVTGFTVIASGGFALASWDLHEALDVRIGGRIEIRHEAVTSGAAWNNGVFMKSFDGNSVTGTLPLVTGTYLAKAVDSADPVEHYSENAVGFVVTEGMVTGFTTVGTQTEAPTFTGTKSGCAVVGSTLQLSSGTLFDSIAGNIDSLVGMFDALGGQSTSATYTFGALDLSTVAVRRFEADIAIDAFDNGDLFDELQGMFDSLDGLFDGDDTAINDGLVVLNARLTNDNPAGTPTWGEWFPFHVGDFNCRAAQFRLDMSVSTPAHNIAVSTLTVHAKEPA